MSQITARTNPIVVDREAGETIGSTRIKYEKEPAEELWERETGSGWSLINVHTRTGTGDEADLYGFYDITLRPGQTYEVCAFREGNGPLTTDPVRVSCLTIFCVLKKPEVRPLITDGNEAFGGTWYWRQIHTNVATNIVTIGVSRSAPTFDSNGIPHVNAPDGSPVAPLQTTNNHLVEIKPLLPGNHYFFVVMVADAFGNWDVREAQFTALRRQLTVEFPTVHVFNDGDGGGAGEAEFWFRVYTGSPQQPNVLEEFYRPQADVNSGKPYSVGFAFVGPLEVVHPDRATVWVGSNSIEEDGFLESDEGAWSRDTNLPFPAGRFVENVTKSTFMMDCPTSTTGDDYHYGVDVRWSVAYMP